MDDKEKSKREEGKSQNQNLWDLVTNVNTKTLFTNPGAVPCWRDSLLWAIGIGTALSLHRFIRFRGDIMRIPQCADHFMLGFTVSGGVSWYYCREKKRRKREIISEMSRASQERAQLGGKVLGEEWLRETDDEYDDY